MSTATAFLYKPATRGTYAELADGTGGWHGIAGPTWSTGWNIYRADLNGDGHIDMFLYKPATGGTYAELADGTGGWHGVPGPTWSTDWSIYPGEFG
jgi:hypothetical protein